MENGWFVVVFFFIRFVGWRSLHCNLFVWLNDGGGDDRCCCCRCRLRHCSLPFYLSSCANDNVSIQSSALITYLLKCCLWKNARKRLFSLISMHLSIALYDRDYSMEYDNLFDSFEMQFVQLNHVSFYRARTHTVCTILIQLEVAYMTFTHALFHSFIEKAKRKTVEPMLCSIVWRKGHLYQLLNEFPWNRDSFIGRRNHKTHAHNYFFMRLFG